MVKQASSNGGTSVKCGTLEPLKNKENKRKFWHIWPCGTSALLIENPFTSRIWWSSLFDTTGSVWELNKELNWKSSASKSQEQEQTRSPINNTPQIELWVGWGAPEWLSSSEMKVCNNTKFWFNYYWYYHFKSVCVCFTSFFRFFCCCCFVLFFFS